MDDRLCRQFFLQPELPNHRRYEALRRYFLNGQALAEIADCLGYRVSSLKSMVCRFRAACARRSPPPFFSQKGAVDLRVSGGRKTKMGPSRPLWRMPVS